MIAETEALQPQDEKPAVDDSKNVEETLNDEQGDTDAT